MVCVITDHAQFTLKEAKSLENANQKDKYDMYDKSNIKDAIKFLLNSLDPALKQQMYENCDQERTSFVVYWMNLMQLIGSVSINRFTKIMNRIRARNINEYSGQDVLAMATDFTNDWKTLHSARMFDHNLTMIMLDSIMQGGTEDFRFELRTLRKRLNKKLLEIRHSPYDKEHQALVEDELDVQSVLKECKQKYLELRDDGKWPNGLYCLRSTALPPIGSANK